MYDLVGRVTQFKYLNNSVSIVYVEFNDDSAWLVAMQFNMTTQQHRVTVKKPEALFGLPKNRQPSVKKTQFPKILSWVFMVHKVQGLSLSKAILR